MTRYFFDYTTKDQSLYDYQGNEFLNPQSAVEFAEATAQVLRQSLTGEWSNWSIEVRDAQGNRFLALPVGTAAPMAA